MSGDTAMLAAATAAKMGGQVASGIAADKAGNAQKGLYDRQANLQQQQALLQLQDYRMAAIQKARQANQFQAEQGLQYLGAGVTLKGTPALMLEQTRQLGQQEVDYLLKRGDNLYQLDMMNAQNLMYQGNVAASAGRNAMIGSIFQAMGTGLAGYEGYQRQSSGQLVYDDFITNISTGGS